ncbi:hypothetical protein K9N68_04675 [Kovacikia minuta CCNUW1]|uniref:hypothetical protein n=1 Tax=Kovacikia minuta TaxID=2931930 RepID=UPI001CCFF5E0|nr:hypothetical protein [Kovacikia minuta]UBF27263.1 hypothetical protein K9N68_04675 [Kovacikia minuta CCNUW1]
MNHRKSRAANVKYMLAGGSVVAALGLLGDPRGLLPNSAPRKDTCQEVIQSKAVLSREQLSRLLTVPERADKAQVRQVLNEPYCKLSLLQIRTGPSSQREAYPLAFDPQTWLVVLYEGEEYVGYSFSFRH